MLPLMVNEQEWCAYDLHTLGNDLDEETAKFVEFPALTRRRVYLQLILSSEITHTCSTKGYRRGENTQARS